MGANFSNSVQKKVFMKGFYAEVWRPDKKIALEHPSRLQVLTCLKENSNSNISTRGPRWPWIAHLNFSDYPSQFLFFFFCCFQRIYKKFFTSVQCK